MKRFARSVVVLLALSCCGSAFAARVERVSVLSRGVQRTYYLFVPDGIDAAAAAPLLITLHGIGHNGSSLVDEWKRVASEEHVIVAGPDSTTPRQWISPDDGPQLLFDVVEDVKRHHPIDDRRIYLFGHSGGATFGVQMALLESEYFAAVAAHAGILQRPAYPLTAYATRKIPFWIAVGTRDPLVPLEAVHQTRDELTRTGFPIVVSEIRNHTHDYYSSADSINREAWKFLSQYQLLKPAHFTHYANTQ